MVVVHAANVHDRDGAKMVFAHVTGRLQRLRLIGADGGDAGQLGDWVKTVGGWARAIIKRTDDGTACHVLPRRWVVARPCAWLGTYRRLSKDDAYLPERSEAWMDAAMLHLMVRRLARLQVANSC